MIIVTILRTQALHTNTNIFIVSVALLDCVMAVSDFTQGIVYSTTFRHNIHVANIIDTVLLGTGYGALTISCTHMAIIAIDRFINIAYPFYYILNVTKRRLIVVLIIAWLFGLAYSTVPIMFYIDDKYHRHCITSSPPLEYFIINASLNVIDYFVIFACYFKIAHLAFTHKKAANARRLKIENPEKVLKLRNTRIAAMKSVKFFVCLFGTFFAFTSPQIFVTGIRLLSFNIPDTIIIIIFYLYEVHSVMNFVIYYHVYKEFSDGFKKLLHDMIAVCKISKP
ncbi:unnamed protein product [Candidula unifasciata]|uniref:G-protein coupled receptors family 1 profile domain-containing protein n=1 Tax=Candidula unifasciata TaxID=100452 RepID=A0A8S4A655_9EUPU|nr:unnamed protein product [Candidula unifasciata]